MQVPSGDDDLFIKEAAKKSNVQIEFSQNSHTLSQAKSSWKEWYSQKRRHLTTSPLYDNKIKFFLSFYSISQFLFLMTFILLLTNNVSYYLWGPLLTVKLFLIYLINYLYFVSDIVLRENSFDGLILMVFLNNFSIT